MPDTAKHDESQSGDRLKSTLWYHVGQLVDEETINLGMNATPQFIGSLTELVWAQIGIVATDLESFAQHAGRSLIKTEDVMLLTRRNNGLEAMLKQRIDDLKKEKLQTSNSSSNGIDNTAER